MQFYEFADNSSYEKQWTFAFGIHARFDKVHWVCPDCGRVTEYPSREFDVKLEGGSEYPDFLGCGEYPFLIVSGRVTAIWRNAGINTFVEYPVGIASIRDSDLSKEQAPKYCHVNIIGECRIDAVATGAKISNRCTRCGAVSTDLPPKKNFVLFDKSWDGSDLFRDHVVYPRVNFCTKKAADLMRSHGFTNVKLTEQS